MYRLKDNKAIEASDEWSSPGFKDAMSNMEANGGKQWNELKQAPAEAMEKAASRIKAVRPCLEKAGYPATAASPQAGSSSNSTAAAEASGVTTHGTLKRSYSLGPGNRLESATPKTPSAPPRPGKPAPPGKPVPSPATAKKA